MDLASLDFAQMLSAQLIGALLEFLLTGAFFVQLVIYRICFAEDPRALRILVYGLGLLMLVRVCLTGYQTQDLFAAGYGNIEKIFTESQRQYARPLGPIIICIVQHFFSYRIFLLERRCWPICILISILSLAQCGVGLATFALLYTGPDSIHGNFDPLNGNLSILDDLGRAWYAGGMTAAVINTLTTAVRRIVRLTIESNAASAALEIISLALLQACPDDPYFAAPSYLLSSVYASMLLVSLNYRVLIRQLEQGETSQASTLSGLQAPPSADLEKSQNQDQERRNATSGPAGEQRESAAIANGSVGRASASSVRISEDTSKRMRHSKTGTLEIRVEEERSVVQR
uniref:Uncharacterized protein n=1 Tax=Mycena chlorophos TaxID=658473 RepID=A0ABQ0LLM2_MYCCL|nr:predicted protein [Mycena chlorophos]